MINRIQNKRFSYIIYECLLCIFIMYINTNTCMYLSKKIFNVYILNIFIYNIK